MARFRRVESVDRDEQKQWLASKPEGPADSPETEGAGLPLTEDEELTALVNTQGETFLRVSRGLLAEDDGLSFDLYMRIGRRLVLYRASNLPADPQLHRKLLEKNLDTIYIQSRDQDNYNKYIERRIPEILSNPQIDGATKAKVVYSSSAYLLQRALAEPGNREVLERTGHMVLHMVDHMLKDKNALLNMVRMTSHHYQTYTHSVDVCLYTISLAQRLGIRNSNDLRPLAFGAILHDLGKSRIDKNILDKRGPLTKDEWQIVRQHPLWGVELLKETPELSPEVPAPSLEPVAEHHERYDGKGYPTGKADNEISLAGRMAAICDVYAALITKRPYRGAMSPYQALKEMASKMKRHFDRELLTEFIMLLGAVEGAPTKHK